jgi:hypothetical protein
MIIQNLDFLSPKITLFFKGRHKHSSIFSGLITILSYSLIVASIIYYTLDFIDRSNPTIYFFNRFIEDTGAYPLNESSLFHYISLISASKNKTIIYDFNSIRIYGIIRTLDSYIQKYEYSENNHWEYTLCNYDEDLTSKKLKNIIDKKTFSQSVCIKRYYSQEDKKYFNKGESGFLWPTLEHGSSHPNRSVYGIIIETCHNDSVKNNCNSIDEIESYFRRYAISLNFIDHYADALNYKEPFTYFINSITSGLTISTTISLNNMNFNPSLMRTHNGIIMDNLVNEKSYSFIKNEKTAVNKQGRNAVSTFYFWMQNNMIYNERYYKKFQELLSNIGGLGSFILLIGLYINSLVSYYIILLDTQDLIFSIKDLNSIKDKLIIKPKILEKKINFQIKNNMNNNNLQNSNYPLFISDKIENEKSSDLLYLYKNNNQNKNKINYRKKNSISYLTNNKIITEYKKVNRIKIPKSNNSYDRINKIILEQSFFEIKDRNNNIIQKPIKKEKFSWISYILYVVLFKRKNPKIKFYENFRAKVLSEENLMQNSYDLYKLLELCNLKKIN